MHMGVGMSESSPEPDQSPRPQIEPTPSQQPVTTRAWLHQTIDTWTERLVRMVFFWETNDKKLGILVRFLHHSLIYMALIWYIVIHTFLPSFTYIFFIFNDFIF